MPWDCQGKAKETTLREKQRTHQEKKIEEKEEAEASPPVPISLPAGTSIIPSFDFSLCKLSHEKIKSAWN